MKTHVLTDVGLTLYDKEMKNYIKKQGIGLTEDDVKKLIDVQVSDDNTYEPLEIGG